MFGYDEEKLIGKGSFGNVYRVKKGEDCFALKEMNDKEMRDREVHFLKLADHPLFPKFVDSFDEGKYYILEEYVWGTPFDECILKRGGFAQPDAMRFAISIADGIAFLQQSDGNILFRDLKAENLILQPDGQIRLCDLGAACFLEEAAMSKAGTEGSSAPEQLTETSKQGMQSDVYAFGRLLYFMLTGKKPPADKYEISVRDVDPSYSACLDLIIMQCTSAEPSVRIPDMYGVLTRLVDIASSSPRDYRKLEKNAKKVIQGMKKGEGTVFLRNIQS